METYKVGVIPEFEAPVIRVRRGGADQGRAWVSLSIRTDGGTIEGFCADDAFGPGYTPSEGDEVRVKLQLSVAYKNNSCRFVKVEPVQNRAAA